MKHLFTFLLLLIAPLSLRAQIVFDGSPGTGPPPATLGGYTTTSFTDNRTDNSDVTSVPSPISGSVTFDRMVRTGTPQGFGFNWGNGYQGVIYRPSATLISLTLPANTKAFYFYTTLDFTGTFNVTATTQNNSATSGPIPITSDPQNGNARYFGFYVSQPAANIQTITISANDGGRLIIGQFGIYQAPTCPTVNATLTASNNGVITCTNPTLTLTAGGGGSGATYTFSGPGLSQSGTQTSASANQKGDYTVSVSGSNGCPGGSKTITITEDKVKPTATLTASGVITCTNQTVRFDLTAAPDIFELRKGTELITGGNSGLTEARIIFSRQFITSGGPVTLSVTNPANGCTNSATAQIAENLAPPTGVRLSNNGPLTTNNPTVTLTATSNSTAGVGVSYGFGPGTTTQGSNQATVTTSGTFSVTATRSDNGCFASANTTVLGANSPTVCRGGTATISLKAPGSPVKYEWYQQTPYGFALYNNSLYQGTTTANLTITGAQQDNVYYAKVYYADGSSAIYGPFRLTINRGCRVGAPEPGTELRLTLLGNPLTGEALKALVEGAQGQRLHVELLDVSGKSVRSQTFEAADSAQAVEWNLNGSGSGLYLLQAVTGQQRQSVKVVKP